MNPDLARLTPALVFGGVGALLVLGSLAAFVRTRARLGGYRRARGAVVDFRVRHATRDGRTRTYYHPRVRFEAGGRVFVHESSVSTSEPRRQLGDAVDLLHHPDNPDEACIDELAEKYFVHMVVGAIGAVFCGVAGWLAAR